MNYEELVKKLENQLIQCQVALDESTRREIDQIKLIMEMKLAQVQKESEEEEGLSKELCEQCKDNQEENKLLH